MSIKDLNLKIKPYLNLTIFLNILAIVWGLAYISQNQVQKIPITVAISDQNILEANGGKVIGSKNGTKYYYPWCGALGRIKPENRVEFASSELARASGYSPAQNCKGVE